MVDKFTKPPYGDKLVEKINDIIDNKQDTLVSGTNIKTINNTSLLGSGNIDIQGGGTVTVDDELSTTSENPVQNKVITTELNKKIEGITSSDVITALGYTPYNSSNPNGYQANEIETIKVNGTAQTITSKAVDISVPTNNNQLTNGAGYITSSALSGYATETYVDTELASKQDTLVSGTNIKTINSTSILGSGNISVATSAQGALADTALQPNDNISELTNNAGYITSSALAPYALSADLSTVATSGSYNDLSDKPTIPAAQVNSDWNASSGVAQILNKPTLATVATSGSYNDLSNKPTIPDTSNLANKDLSNLSSTGNAKFQAPLVSGTNIKTVNGNSLLGSGDITIQSGASYSATCPAITPVDGVATWVVTHNLGTQAVVTALYSNGNKVEHNTLVTSNNAITVTFKASSAVTAGSYKIVVLASGGSGGGSADDTYTSATTNVNIVGSLTNNQGVLSGFSANTNYGQLPTTLTLGNDFDIVFKVKIGSDFNLQPTIAAAYNQIALAILLNSSHKIQISTGNGSSWGDILESNTTISANTDYKFKFSLHNSVLSIYIEDGNGNFVLDNSMSSTASIPNATIVLGVSRALTAAWDGSIDLNESYIDINSERVWTGAENIELTNLSPVTDYYVSGSSWCKETFSDATRTQRIWLEQGGYVTGSTTITLLKSYSNNGYDITTGATATSGSLYSPRISSKTASGFAITVSSGGGFWHAIGV